MRHLAIVCLVLLAGCASRVDDSAITVYAAASMTDVSSEVAAGFAAAPVKTSFGSSGELARQIDDGAPADVFISASRDWADYLQDKGRLEGGYRVFACKTRAGLKAATACSRATRWCALFRKAASSRVVPSRTRARC